MTEQNNELLIKNHETRPTGFAPFPEVNATIINNNGWGHGHGKGYGRGRGRNTSSYHKYAPYYYKENKKEEKQEGTNGQKKHV